MDVMPTRSAVVTALFTASLAGLALSTYLYVWPGMAPAPRWLPGPAPVAIVPRPAFPMTTRSVEVRRGDTLARTLMRGGIEARAANELAAQFARNGADLRKLRLGAAVEIISNFRDEPIAVRYEANPWLSFAARPVRGGWQVGRAETLPDVRVEAVSGVVQRSLFDAVERTGESARLVLGLVEIFSSDFDFTADTRVGDRFRLLVEKRYAGNDFVDYGRILVAQYASGGKTLTGIGLEQASRYGHYDLAGQSLRKSFLKSPLEFSRITVVAQGSTLGVRQVVFSITRPLEEAVSIVPGVTRVRSHSIRGAVEMQITFAPRAGRHAGPRRRRRRRRARRVERGQRHPDPSPASLGLRDPVQPSFPDHRGPPAGRARAAEADHRERRRHRARDGTPPRLPRRA